MSTNKKQKTDENIGKAASVTKSKEEFIATKRDKELPRSESKERPRPEGQ